MLWVLSQFDEIDDDDDDDDDECNRIITGGGGGGGGGGALDLVKTFLTVVIRLISPLNNCNTDIRILLFTIE
ncbi:hypothetical protein T07_12672 [Trichinella nelsoni]|uniref:Uncharacterized protein n=1 Tax=Trichinella nelsoni TaxID=6336 RepID=A0A0V0RY13_9BILA|nr:hypothetical protein T07_12672 [Trichinella nelsoni]